MHFFTIIKQKIIIIVDLIVQQHIMKKSPEKIKKPTRKQIEKMELKEIIQIVEGIDKKTKIGMDKISWWKDE